MEPVLPLVLMGVGALVLAAFLLVVPLVQVTRRARSWRGVSGLWLAGWGFLLLGLGLVFAHRGWGNAVLPGIVLAVAGHLVQLRWAAAPARRKGG